MLYENSNSKEIKMAKHYGHKKMMKGMKSKKMMNGKKSKPMMMPRDAAGSSHGNSDDQLYHMGKGYYGPGYGHIANMPPYADMHYYPKETKYLDTDKYPDTVREIDHDSDVNMGNLKRQPSDSMY